MFTEKSITMVWLSRMENSSCPIKRGKLEVGGSSGRELLRET